MKTIILKKMHFLNFKGLRELEIEFDEKSTSIYGRNGSGKTTIFDGFTWVLFGKDSFDRKTFDIKTLDIHGVAIPRLPHEVSVILLVDGEEVTLCRRYKEKWQKKRGQSEEEFTGHEEERLYNDVPCNVKEWNEKIAGLCSEQIFKFITSPSYFTSQKTDAQRAMLIRMAGGISDEEIADDNEDFKELLKHITGKSLEEYKREVAAKKRPIKDEIDGIPERIDERNRDMPESYDYDALEKELQDKKSELAKVEASIEDASKAITATNEKRLDLAKKLADLRQEKLSLGYTIKGKVQEGYRKALETQNNLKDEIKRLEQSAKSLSVSIENDEENLKKCQELREKLLKEWHEVNDQKIKFNDEDFICPTCKRPLDVDDIEAKQKEMTENFNSQKASKLEEINRKGKQNKAKMETYDTAIGQNKKDLDTINKKIEEIKASDDYKVVLVEPDATDTIKADEKYIALSSEIRKIDEELAKPIDRPNTLVLKDKKASILAEIDGIKEKLNSRETAKRNQERISELETRLRTLSDELANYEKMEFTIQNFSKARIEAVERKINGMFKLVSFKMFDKQINGGEVETCEAMVCGVPYSSLNHAMKINAGLDIINAICKFEGITAPIFTDNAESINELLPTQSQIIRLVVSEDDKLTIKKQ